MSFIRLAARNAARPCLAFAVPRTQKSVPWRAGFSAAAAAGLKKETIARRVLDVLKGFEKVNPLEVLSNYLLGRFVATYTFFLPQADYHVIVQR
jgi:hypothetical protein